MKLYFPYFIPNFSKFIFFSLKIHQNNIIHFFIIFSLLSFSFYIAYTSMWIRHITRLLQWPRSNILGEISFLLGLNFSQWINYIRMIKFGGIKLLWDFRQHFSNSLNTKIYKIIYKVCHTSIYKCPRIMTSLISLLQLSSLNEEIYKYQIIKYQ